MSLSRMSSGRRLRVGWWVGGFTALTFGGLIAVGRSAPAPEPAVEANAKPATKPVLVTRFYDIRDLLYEPADFDPFPLAPRQSGGGGGGGGGGGLFGNASAGTTTGKTEDKLVEELLLIIRRGLSEPPDGIGEMYSAMGRLMVTHTEAMHARVREVLSELRKTQDRPVRIRAHWVLADRAELEKVVKSAGEVYQTIDPAALTQPPFATTHLQAELLCTSGRFVSLGTSREKLALTDVNPVADQVVPDPTLSALSEGLQLFARASLLEDHRSVRLRVQSDWQSADVQPGGMKLPILPSTRPAASTQPTGDVRIDRTDSRTFRLATETTIPAGLTVLIGGLTLDPVEPINPEGLGAHPAPATRPVTDRAAPIRQLYLFVQVLPG